MSALAQKNVRNSLQLRLGQDSTDRHQPVQPCFRISLLAGFRDLAEISVGHRSIGSLNRWVVEQGRPLLLDPQPTESRSLLCCWALIQAAVGLHTSQHLPISCLGQRVPRCESARWFFNNRVAALAPPRRNAATAVTSKALELRPESVAERRWRSRCYQAAESLEPAFHRCARCKGVRIPRPAGNDNDRGGTGLSHPALCVANTTPASPAWAANASANPAPRSFQTHSRLCLGHPNHPLRPCQTPGWSQLRDGVPAGAAGPEGEYAGLKPPLALSPSAAASCEGRGSPAHQAHR